MTKIDMSTGLPELPEGYFWRIKRAYGRILTVQVRFNGKLWSKKVYEIQSYATDEGVQDAALRLSRKLSLYISQNGNVSRLVGDYPPKKLNA